MAAAPSRVHCPELPSAVVLLHLRLRLLIRLLRPCPVLHRI